MTGMGLGLGVDLGGAKSPFDPDASAYFTRSGVTDSTAKSKISSFIGGLKGLGLYSLLTGCWIGRSAYNAGSGTTVFDLVSNSLNGTFTNSPAWGTDGIVFTGSTQCVVTGRTQTMNVSWSVFTVVKVVSVGAASRRIIGSGTPNPTLLFCNGSNVAAMPIGTYDGASVASAGSLDVTTFKMLGQTYSVANKQNFFSGGSSIGTAAVTNVAASQTVQLSSNGEGLDSGTISVAMIFGATELTPTQEASLYSLLKNTICFDQSLP